MSNYYFDEAGRIVIDEFASQGPFASFLPGIAGTMGVPMWVFYVNRGQGIAGFGVESKDTPIMEFQPANKAYQSVPYTGFRTFIKSKNGHTAYYEPFLASQPNVACSQRMYIGANEFELEEINPQENLQVNVLYFTLPGESFAGLVRQVTITNTGSHPLDIEVLDGLIQVMPYGVNNWLLKEINKTIEAWMEVFNLDQGIPFYHLRASVADKVEVEGIQAGHFYLSFVEDTDQSTLLPAFIDPTVVFGQNTTLSYPQNFINTSLSDLVNMRQITVGRTPCGLFGAARLLAANESLTIYSIIGHVSDIETINCECGRLTKAGYIAAKHREATALTQQLTDVVDTHTSDPTFDAYCRQTFLDNVMRGGWPEVLGGEEKPFIYHIYSRKHGDLERDYNAFFLAAEYYSQGNGAYRDVNQNRRSDVLFNPQVKDFNIRLFMNLIQTDGYNPLVIQGSRFYIPTDKLPALETLVECPEQLTGFLTKPFSPGQLLKYLTDRRINLKVSPDDLLTTLLSVAEQQFIASPGEGYWVDHWTYNLDLIESYLAIYRDYQDELLFGRDDYTFYDNPTVVRPRADKYVLVEDTVRQLHALHEDEEKAQLIASRTHNPQLVRTEYGQGEIYRTTLFAKLTCVALLKFATLDQWGMGVEMEAGRPGWYDALNGLPGLLGTSMPETYELNRLLRFMRAAIKDKGTATVILPVEVYDLLMNVVVQVEAHKTSTTPKRDFIYWDAVSTLREQYRASTRLGLSGRTETVLLAELERILRLFQDKVIAGIERAEKLNHSFPPTYFAYDVEAYDIQTDQDGNPRLDPNGRPYVIATKFKAKVLPPFLEGPVRALKIMEKEEQAKALYQQVKQSTLFDNKLKTYKVNASLEDQPIDIGRAKAFTPGWLENESIWLHMAYKYLLSTLQAGLYEEFYEDLRTVLIPFLDPNVYGRSPLENSSFLVSSAHPDDSLHGRGFVARLSGSTAEFMSIWNVIMAGKQPFTLQNGNLCFELKPILPAWLFDEDNTLSFTFLGNCKVVYHNPTKGNTFGDDGVCPVNVRLITSLQSFEFTDSVVPGQYAEMIRSGQVSEIAVTLG